MFQTARPYVLTASLTLLVACQSDLGRCDQDAAVTVVYGRQNLVATAGQALAHDSCGSGVYCHSAGATGAARYGAPLRMDFDMIPGPSGWFAIQDHRVDAWQEIGDETMPPSGEGATKVGDSDWRYDIRRGNGARKLAGLNTDEGKEIFRNWLACRAPTVEETTLRIVVPQQMDMDAATVQLDAQTQVEITDGGEGARDAGPLPPDFTPIFETILKPTCAVAPCHDQGAAAGMDLSEECSAYEALKSSGPCGRPRVVPFHANSLLLTLLHEAQPCARQMPPLIPLPDSDIEIISQWIYEGAHAASCE